MSVPDPTLVLSGVGASLRGVWRFAGRAGPATFLAAGSVAILIVLAAVDAGGRAAWWERAHLTLSAVVALYVAGGSLRRTAGRTHEVRGWIAFACAGWLASELLRDVDALGINVPIPPDFVLVVVIAAAAAAYRADLRDRFRFVEEISVYLDAAIVSAAAAAGFLLLFAMRGPDPYDPMLLVYGLVFLSLLGATAILDLAVLAELRAMGAYAILAGLGLLAIGFLGRSGTIDPATRWAFAGLISAGVLAVGYGTATWTDVVDTNPRYARLATRIRDLIPLAAISFVPVILIRAEGLADGLALRAAIDGCIAVVVLAAILRQSALLAERGRVLAGLSTALAAAERRAQQVAGIEEGGRVLALSGATSLALDHVATSLADRFGYAHVAIYVGDGPDLEPRVAHGIRTLDPPLHGARGIVGRVVDTHRPAFVPDVTRDPDYVSGDEQVKGEICVPLLDGERFLGVLDVQTTRLEALDDSDLAAALAVADRVASALALDRERSDLLSEKDFVSAIFNSVGAMVIVTDGERRVVRMNDACFAVSGYARGELEELGSLDVLIAPEDRARVGEVIASLEPGQAIRLENDWVRKDGTRRHIAWSNTAVTDEQGQVRYTIASGIDITDRKRLEEQLARQALHDSLTGLPNRRLLMDRLEQAVRSRPHRTIGLLFLDLDDFKAINDSLAHAAGDDVLVQVATRLLTCVRGGDTVARVGGDEFAVLIDPVTDPSHVEDVAWRIQRALDVPFDVAEHRVGVQASIGIATNPDGREGADSLLANADVAMYWAKREGPAHTAVFRPDMHAAVRERRDLEMALREAINRDEFSLFYQPIFDLNTGSMVGAEGLLRWARPSHGLIAPLDFLPTAEQAGLIVPIGAWVIREACRQLRRWRDVLGSSAPPWLSINVSPRQLQDPSLIGDITESIARERLAPSDIVLEVTESVVMEDTETMIQRLQALNALGVKLAIDDFGTGYSALSYLDRLPVQIVKIDRSFVSEIRTDPKRMTFIRTIVGLCQALGLETIAEGVETQVEADELRRAGCDLAQGFVFAKALAPGAFERWARHAAAAPKLMDPSSVAITR